VAKAFLPAMREAGRGSFITVGSVADHVGFPGNAAYAASKYGLRGLHETVAEAILFVATRPPHVLIDWLRLGPVGKA
jgi:NADP-dependent 3-hydroxy acid dehydrogenase YdfG